MDKIFEEALFTRKALMGILKAYTHEQLNAIPSGFNNSIYWNIAHLLVTPALLCYRRSGIEVEIDEEFIRRYAKGSKPADSVPLEEIEYLKDNLVESAVKLKKDYMEGRFAEFDPYMTSTGIELTNIEDAIKFSAFHDGIHLGVVLSLKKLV